MNFKLRPWSMNDLDSLVKYANNYNITKFLSDHFPYPYTDENGKAFIETAIKTQPFNILAIEVGGEAAGGIGIHPRDGIERKNAELVIGWQSLFGAKALLQMPYCK